MIDGSPERRAQIPESDDPLRRHMSSVGSPAALATTNLPLALLRRGKVRDVYEVDEKRLLIVATDRISAFDVVMREPVPYKGAVLTQLSAWWFRQLSDLVAHHLITADAGEIVERVPRLAGYGTLLRGRTMLCRRTTVFPVECVIRGFLTGSAWKEYRQRGTLAGEPLPSGMRESERLTPPLFSPATKADAGHDENITTSQMARIIGATTVERLESLTRRVYDFACRSAEPRGILIADTKFEFGAVDDEILLIDEVLTPDSSRFWPADEYQVGRSQPSFDKQPLRDYLEGERVNGRWNGDAPAPRLPSEVVAATSARYLDAYRRITGSHLDISELT